MQNETEVLNLIAVWDKEEQKRRKRNGRVQIIGFSLVIGSSLIRIIALFGHGRHWWGKMPLEWQYFLTMFTGTNLIVSFITPFVSYRHRQLVNDLAGIEDIHAVGPLLATLDLPYTKHRASIIATLARLLPQLKASDASLLNARQKTILYGMPMYFHASTEITVSQKSAYRLAALHAIEQIGDAQAIPFVERLINDKEASRGLRNAAHSCLSVLRERAKQQQQSQTLLRASNAEGDTASLLKPASSGGQSVENLLRPSS